MKVHLTNICGIPEAMSSLYLSKRTWTPEKQKEIQDTCAVILDRQGKLIDIEQIRKHNEEIEQILSCAPMLHDKHQMKQRLREELISETQYQACKEQFDKLMDKVIKYGVEYGHTTLLRQIKLAFVVEGIHRGAQDDLDAHAKRMEGTPLRSSTRLASFSDGEKSDWYQGKILNAFEGLELAGVEIPDTVTTEDGVFKRVEFGYINEKYFGTPEEQDVKRGVYPLSIPSNIMFSVQYPELGHIIQHRDSTSHAHPELRDAAELMKEEVTKAVPQLGKNLTKIIMQPAGRRQ